MTFILLYLSIYLSIINGQNNIDSNKQQQWEKNKTEEKNNTISTSFKN